MRIEFYRDPNPRLQKLEIAVKDAAGNVDPDDLLRVKRLPGRYYDYLRELWIVPIKRGLSETLQRSGGETWLGVALLALIEFEEADLVKTLEAPAPPMTYQQLFHMPAINAVDRAFEYHLETFHHGDLAEYERVHGPITYAPEVKPKKERKGRGPKDPSKKKVEIS